MQQHASTYSVLTHTLNPWGEVIGQTRFFLRVVMLHIKLKGVELRAPRPYTPPKPVVGLKGKKKI